MGDLVDRVIECSFVSLRRLGEAGDLANELKRRGANFVARRRRKKIMQSFDVSAHAPSINNSLPAINSLVSGTLNFSGSALVPSAGDVVSTSRTLLCHHERKRGISQAVVDYTIIPV